MQLSAKNSPRLPPKLIRKRVTKPKLSTAGNKPDLIGRLEEDDKEKQAGDAAAGMPILHSSN